MRQARYATSTAFASVEASQAIRPDAFIGVDAPDFNLWLEGKVRAEGIPAIHFVSPSIWAWRGGRIKGISRAVSHMLCLFPFEPALYEKAGVPVSYVGHPLADVFPLQPDRNAARERLNLPEDRRVVALLPGSRQSEVRNLATTYIATARILAERHPDICFVVPPGTVAMPAATEPGKMQAVATDTAPSTPIAA